MSKKKNIICPICGSSNVAKYIFGLVGYDDELQEQLDKNEIVLGGCCIEPDSPAYHCNECE